MYGLIVIMLYAWTLLWFFWKVPSWLYFRNAAEILITLAYSLATNLVESLVVLGVLLGLTLALPRAWFHDVFVARGASFCIAVLGYLMLVANQFPDETAYPAQLLRLPTLLLAAASIAVLVYVSGRFARVRKILGIIVDRFSIFAYILFPVSTLSLLFVLIRWLVA